MQSYAMLKQATHITVTAVIWRFKYILYHVKEQQSRQPKSCQWYTCMKRTTEADITIPRFLQTVFQRDQWIQK
jgi:hypothetical protein